ncbi:hypothetical protein [Rhizobium sophoriradicis]|uniref:hypothetical protein n=1 Tax=Rhizobium sophoriradicis TaxID=1535245 RepID=UPI001142CE4B|nr:hypothetical protein [Rhizobium sophoriradicis]
MAGFVAIAQRPGRSLKLENNFNINWSIMLTKLIMFFMRQKEGGFLLRLIRNSPASPSSVRRATTSQPGNHF